MMQFPIIICMIFAGMVLSATISTRPTVKPPAATAAKVAVPRSPKPTAPPTATDVNISNFYWCCLRPTYITHMYIPYVICCSILGVWCHQRISHSFISCYNRTIQSSFHSLYLRYRPVASTESRDIYWLNYHVHSIDNWDTSVNTVNDYLVRSPVLPEW
jgi:hypothetical protein